MLGFVAVGLLALVVGAAAWIVVSAAAGVLAAGLAGLSGLFVLNRAFARRGP